jgi:hypothetical protein
VETLLRVSRITITVCSIYKLDAKSLTETATHCPFPKLANSGRVTVIDSFGLRGRVRWSSSYSSFLASPIYCSCIQRDKFVFKIADKKTSDPIMATTRSWGCRIGHRHEKTWILQATIQGLPARVSLIDYDRNIV